MDLRSGAGGEWDPADVGGTLGVCSDSSLPAASGCTSPSWSCCRRLPLLTWWQFERAYNGNTLSWAYTFEWPLFAGYAIYVWWQLIHDDPTVFTRRQGAEARAGR